MPRRPPPSGDISAGVPTPPDRFAPSLPTNGQELMAAWELPPEAWENLTVKTTRFIRGTQQLELLESCPVADWEMGDMARAYGPGIYRIQAGPGPHKAKNSTITVSREYATASGFAAAPMQPPPPPDPHQMMASRTFQMATQGAVDPVSLAAMIQTAVDNAAAKTAAKQQDATSQIDLFFKGFETAKAMLGLSTPAEITPKSWVDVVSDNLPSILGTLQTAMGTMRPQTPQPTPQPQRPELSNGAQPMPTTERPTQQFPEPPPATIPLLQIMKNYSHMLRNHLEGERSPEDLARQLWGLLGPDLDPAIIATAAHIAEHGPAILGNAAPYLATDKAATVIIQWATIINQETEG